MLINVLVKGLTVYPYKCGHLDSFWKAIPRLVDSTSVVQQLEHKDNFLKYTNTIDQSIKFTTEDTYQDGFMAFLDTLVT